MKEKRRNKVFVLLALIFSGCHAASDSKPEPAYAKLPTASEVFNLRTKCAQLGQKILDDDLHGPAVSIREVSNYNPQTNRCYVKLEASPADLSAPMDKYYVNTSVYDGQTGELLVVANYKNLPGWGGPWDEKHEQKSGTIFYEHICTAEPCIGYEAAMKEIESFMRDSRQR
jgi:hypothetical protein